MSTPWTVTSDAERCPLDERRQGRITFTVSNTGAFSERAMFEIVTDPAAQDWFSVAEPQRRIPPGASERFEVRAELPTTASPGQYQVQARVYSLDSAPEETSVLSGRISIELAGPPPARPRRRPWWLVVPAVVVLVVAAVVVTVVTREEAPPAAEPSPTVVVPSLAGMTGEQAVAALVEAGLVPKVRNRHVAGTAGVTQSIQAGLVVARNTAIDVVVPVNLSPPVLTSPDVSLVMLPRAADDPTAGRVGTVASSLAVAWTQAEPWVRSWRVVVAQLICAVTSNDITQGAGQYTSVDISVDVTAPTFEAIRYFTRAPTGNYPQSCGEEIVRVAAIDDFGGLGPFGEPTRYRLAR